MPFIDALPEQITNGRFGRGTAKVTEEVIEALLASANAGGVYKTHPNSAREFDLWQGRLRTQGAKLRLSVSIHKATNGDVIFKAIHKDGTTAKPAAAVAAPAFTAPTTPTKRGATAAATTSKRGRRKTA